MEITIEIPDGLGSEVESTAAQRGQTVQGFIVAAIRAGLVEEGPCEPAEEGWRRVFGRASPEMVADVDAAIAEEFE